MKVYILTQQGVEETHENIVGVVLDDTELLITLPTEKDRTAHNIRIARKIILLMTVEV